MNRCRACGSVFAYRGRVSATARARTARQRRRAVGERTSRSLNVENLPSRGLGPVCEPRNSTRKPRCWNCARGSRRSARHGEGVAAREQHQDAPGSRRKGAMQARPRRNLRDTQSRTRRASTVGPRRAAFIVDEAVTVTEDELGACTLGDLVRRRQAVDRSPLPASVGLTFCE